MNIEFSLRAKDGADDRGWTVLASNKFTLRPKDGADDAGVAVSLGSNLRGCRGPSMIRSSLFYGPLFEVITIKFFGKRLVRVFFYRIFVCVCLFFFSGPTPCATGLFSRFISRWISS